MHSSWHEFIQAHSGKGLSMTELASLYKKKHGAKRRGAMKEEDVICYKRTRSAAGRKRVAPKRRASSGERCRDERGRFESCSSW